MSESYYKPCRELDICNELIEKYFNTQQYEKCFEGHLVLAEQGYPLAECQIGYFYYDGLGVEKDLAKAVWWTRRAADHGDRDGQCNLAWFYEDGIGVERDMEQAAFWYRQAALQDHDLAIDKCKELGISLDDEITDREGLRKVLKCKVFPLNYLPSYKYTVICTNYKGKWILSKHKKRDTWETQGGHIEDGETPLEAAKRELFEESGSGMRMCILSAITGDLIRSGAPTAWCSLRLCIPSEHSRRAKCRELGCLMNCQRNSLIPRHPRCFTGKRRSC